MFCYRHPYKPAILMGMMVAVFVAGTPELAMAAPTYDPVFYYYHGDHLGSASVMTDRDGLMVQRYGYRPFGDERFKDNTLAFSVPNRYTNQVLDEDTGLYYYGARYYDPELARFTQPDTIVPDPCSSQALNRYSYVYNNPLKFTDPDGNFPFLAFIFWGAVIGAGVSAGIAAATGGNVWKAALGGAVAGALTGFGYGAWGVVGAVACGAAGGALSAVITGGDPLMAAATAALTATILGVVGWQAPDSLGAVFAEEGLKNLIKSTGVGALVGGITAEISGGDFAEGAMWGAVAAASAFAVTMLLEPFLAPMANTQLAAPDLQPLACTTDLAEPVTSDSWIGSGDPSTADEGIIAHESIAGDLNPPQSFWQRLAGGRNWKTITNAGAKVHNFTLKRTLPQFEKHLLRNGWKRVPSSGDAKGVQVFIKGARRYVLRPANVGKTKLPTAEYLKVAGKQLKHLGKIRLVPE